MPSGTPPTPPFRSIDLFCGSGGLLLGFDAAGFETRLAADNWKAAIATLERNFPGVTTADFDLREATGADLLSAAGLEEPPAMITGGPPCQGFSSAGARRNGDQRNTLVAAFARLVAAIRPRAFLFENVEGFLTAEGGARVIELLDPLIEAGYRVDLRKVNAANYGVPQHRKRVVGIGALGGEPRLPPPTHYAFGVPGAHRVPGGNGKLRAPSVEEWLAGLPAVSDPSAPSDHELRSLGAHDRARIAALEPGQTMRDLPEHLQHPSYRRRALRRVMDGTPTERRGGAPAGLRRLVSYEPSKAITSAASRELVHPIEDRPLTLRECARLQSFPDGFVFEGSRTDRALLIGNAVPPLLAQVIGRRLRAWLTSHDHPGEPGEGALVAFDPTVSVGMSPALAEVKRKVEGRYAPRQGALWV